MASELDEGVFEERPKLTRREREVMVLILEGKSSKEAAQSLGLSTRTIEYHLANVYRKLRVSNKMQAFREIRRLGLLMPEDGFLFSEL